MDAPALREHHIEEGIIEEGDVRAREVYTYSTTATADIAASFREFCVISACLSDVFTKVAVSPLCG